MVEVVAKALPRIGLGMAALGRPGYINLERGSILDQYEGQTTDAPTGRSIEFMREKANAVMSVLLEESRANNFLPWFDCARSYGLSEQFVGEFLRKNQVKPDQVVVSSKWGYTYVADWKVQLQEGLPHEIKDHSVENFLRQIEETRAFVGEYVDLYQVHSATFESGILTDSRVHDALASCKRENGWRIGLSVSGPNQGQILKEAMKIVATDGTRLFDSVQCTFNVLEQRPGHALLEAYNQGMDIIVKEGMANGRILKNEKFLKIAKNSGYPSDQLALACILAQPFHPRVLSGAITPEQLRSNVGALEVSKMLQTDKTDVLEEVLKECAMESEHYWAERSALAWN